MGTMISTTIFLFLLHSAASTIYLTNTQDGSSIEYYDCFMVDSVSYCRRPEHPINLTRTDSHACNQNQNGVTHSFSDLRIANVNVSIVLHQWKSSIEQVERYSRYLRQIGRASCRERV